ncbi:hypothetical protein [Tomitella biformata]|uniref:hypothetical protein n=1 Tax=Tomitella biformata TaxID=630403 RepID=UPI00130E1E7B|nr:hypothetical protein [Tomitella biformata]
MTKLKPGSRLGSTESAAQVIVTRGGHGVITCGGVPMLAADAEVLGNPQHTAIDGEGLIVLGKRYRCADTSVEVLCVRQGTGKLQLDGAPMDLVTQAKPLPASD